MDTYRLVLTLVVTAAVVLAILLFERRRAERITRDTRDLARGLPTPDERRRDRPGGDDSSGGDESSGGDGPVR